MNTPKYQLFDGKPKEMWEICRDHITHENDLLDHRINWFLIIQGFSFTVFVGLLAAPSPDAIRYTPLVAGFAFVTAFLLHPFVAAAVNAHYVWAENWLQYLKWLKSTKNIDDSVDPLTLFPDIVGDRQDHRKPGVVSSIVDWYCKFGSWLLPLKQHYPEHSVFRLIEAISLTWFILGAVMVFAIIQRH